jgi:predicted transcriptional regulator
MVRAFSSSFCSETENSCLSWLVFLFFYEDLSATNLMFGVAENAPMLVALKIYSTRNISRVFVTKGQNPNKLKNVITQSYIVSYLLKQYNGDPHRKRTDQQTFLERYENVTMKKIEPASLVDEESLALKAFELMHSMKIPTVGVTRKGKLIGSVTAQDLRVIPTLSFLFFLFYFP